MTAPDPLTAYITVREAPERGVSNVMPVSPGDLRQLRELFTEAEEAVDWPRVWRRLRELRRTPR